MITSTHSTVKHRIEPEGLKAFFEWLLQEGFQVIGPKVRDGAVMIEPLQSFTDLPRGYCEEQYPGGYRLKPTDDGSFFGYTVGPQSFKQFLHPPRRLLWKGDKVENGFTVQQPPDPPKMAFFGLRSCDLRAIEILDQIFLKGPYVNPWYQKAREQLWLITVGCGSPSSNCFCTSAGHGVVARNGFDINLIEVLNEGDHYFLIESGSVKGEEYLEELECYPATFQEMAEARALLDHAESTMTKNLDQEGLPEMLKQSLDHPHWDDVAQRCLACGNCTMVCPTCFCTNTEEVSDLAGDHTERWLHWDSCFNGDFSYIHGGTIRNSIKSRYRQWLTHKMSSWHEQFGMSGCVGCGRCITWCPVGIDLTQEIEKLKS